MEDQGIQDAAIFLMSIGEEEAAEVFKHLSPKEVQKLGETIAKTRSVSHERVAQGGMFSSKRPFLRAKNAKSSWERY